MLEHLEKLGGILHLDINRIDLTFESNGQTIEVGRGKSFRLLSVEGIESSENELFTSSTIMGDGVKLTNTKIKGRPIMVEAEYTGKNKELARRKLMSFFNVHKTGAFTVNYGGRELNIEYTPQSFKSNLVNVNNPLKFLVDLYCPNPYWKSPDLTVEPLAPFIELFEFPSDYWAQEEDGELYFEVGFEGEKRELVVHGDVESPVQIRFYGPSTNPVIRNNTTDEFIKVNRTLTTEDVLFIDTEDSIVTINGENVFNWIDINSTFWKLQEGANEIEYTADAGVADAKLEIMWNEKYMGV